MDSSSSKSRFLGDLTISWKVSKVHSLHSQGFAGIFSPISSNLKLNSFVVTMTETGSAHHLAHHPSLFTNNSSRNRLSQSDSLIPAPRSSFHRNFLDLFVSTVWYSQLNLGKLKSPLRARAVDAEIFLNTGWCLGCSQQWWGWCEGCMNAVTRETHFIVCY